MERHFATRREQLLADAEVDPRIPRGVLARLEKQGAADWPPPRIGPLGPFSTGR
jgi:hypothetical protein